MVYDRLGGLPTGRASRPVFAWYGDMDLASHFWRFAQHRGLRVSVLLHPPLDPARFASRKALSHAVWQTVADGASRLRQNRPVEWRRGRMSGQRRRMREGLGSPRDTAHENALSRNRRSAMHVNPLTSLGRCLCGRLLDRMTRLLPHSVRPQDQLSRCLDHPPEFLLDEPAWRLARSVCTSSPGAAR